MSSVVLVDSVLYKRSRHLRTSNCACQMATAQVARLRPEKVLAQTGVSAASRIQIWGQEPNELFD